MKRLDKETENSVAKQATRNVPLDDRAVSNDDATRHLDRLYSYSKRSATVAGLLLLAGDEAGCDERIPPDVIDEIAKRAKTCLGSELVLAATQISLKQYAKICHFGDRNGADKERADILWRAICIGATEMWLSEFLLGLLEEESQ